MFDQEFGKLGAIGTMFGVSSHACGKWLAELGLRKVGGAPTAKAFALGLPKKVPTNRGNGDGYFYVWHVERTAKLLEEAGHKRIQEEEPPAAPKPNLVAPFSMRQSGDCYEILNGNGDVFGWCLAEKGTAFIVQIFNRADDNGLLPRE
jgi:hypothetical protein